MAQPLAHGLIVEDHPDARAWLEASLAQAIPGITLAAVPNLAEARRQITVQAPDIAVIDLGLPDGSGIDLIRELHDQSPHTLKIVSSIFSDDRHLFDALRAGAFGYILKDESQEQLVAMLQGIIAGNPPLSPSIATRVLNHFHAPRQTDQEKLTNREVEVLTLLARGHTVKATAAQLGLTPNTTATYVKTIYQKLNINSRAEATIEASRRGLIDAS